LVTQEEADRIYRAKKYIADDSLSWKVESSQNGEIRAYIKATVLTDDGIELELRGTKGSRHSFSLLYKKSVVIRQFDFKHYYETENGERITIPHKHFWDGVDNDKKYAVNDVDINNVNKALFDFLKECNIEFNGAYQTIIA
jgi:hypothetical protein